MLAPQIVLHPGYQSLQEVARSIGCRLSLWEPELMPSGGVEFHVQRLKARSCALAQASVVTGA